MQCGAPVITSNTTALVETVGESALLVNPLDVAAIAQAMTALLENDGLSQTLSAQGRRHARRFSWEQTATMTAEIYHMAAS
jgi:glycosyltransferase involved in cell wall biosynthesis